MITVAAFCTPEIADRLSKSMPSIWGTSDSRTGWSTSSGAPMSGACSGAPSKAKNSKSTFASLAGSADSALATWSKATTSASIAGDAASNLVCAMTGSCNGTSLMSLPSVCIASALVRNADAVHAPSVPLAMSSIQREKPTRLSPVMDSKSWLAGFWSASQLLNSCSIVQAASPNSLRPTIRALPLSVWKTRRRMVN